MKIFKKLSLKLNPISIILKQRAEKALDSLETEFKYLKETSENKSAFDIANESLKKARITLNEDVDVTWNFIHIAELNILRCTDKDRWSVKAEMIKIEAEKIGEWRQKQIYKLLGNPKEEIKITTVEEVVMAMEIRNDFYNTGAHKQLLRKASLNSLAIALVTIMILIITFSSIFEINELGERIFWQQAIIIVLYGGLGASLSLAYSISQLSIKTKIPDQLAGVYIIIIRLAIGGTAALISYLLLKSKLVNITLGEEHFGYLVIGFVAGFSERWVVRLLDNISNDTKSEVKVGDSKNNSTVKSENDTTEFTSSSVFNETSSSTSVKTSTNITDKISADVSGER